MLTGYANAIVGNEKILAGTELRANRVVSCGCYHREQKTKHGQYNTRIYRIWRKMKYRCYDTKAKAYKNYGGRGITICDEWKDEFINFYNWSIQNGYEDSLTIDRIDNNGNYEPNNCRWATYEEQANNRRQKQPKKYYIYQGKEYSLQELAEELQIPYKTLWGRIKNNKTDYADIIKEKK